MSISTLFSPNTFTLYCYEIIPTVEIVPTLTNVLSITGQTGNPITIYSLNNQNIVLNPNGTGVVETVGELLTTGVVPGLNITYSVGTSTFAYLNVYTENVIGPSGHSLSLTPNGTNVVAVNGNGMIFNNSVGSYVPSDLNYYEVTTASITFTGPFANPLVITIDIMKIGRSCILQFPICEAQTSVSTGAFITGTAIPARFWPIVDSSYPITVLDASADVTTPGNITVLAADGTMKIYVNCATGNFTQAGGYSGFYGTNITFFTAA